MLQRQSPRGFTSLFPFTKVGIHQILAVVVPQGGDGAGARFPQQTESEAAVDVHPDLLLRQPSLSPTHAQTNTHTDTHTHRA